ncbi:MAG TPA: TraB/GumN family protein [Mucilaginibacter sp.]|jgi:hypothetical protein
MKKLLVLISLLFAIVIYAQTKKPAQTPVSKNLLWKISGNGLSSSSYLFGTSNFAGKRFADSLFGIIEKFNACKVVVSEAIIDSAYLSALSHSMYFSDNTLDKILTPQEYNVVESCIKSISTRQLKNLNNFKPAALELYLLSKLYFGDITATNPGLVKYFQIEGKKRGDKIVGLETIEFQMELNLNSPIEDQKRRLLFTISKMDAAKKNMTELNSLYYAQDIVGIYKMMMEVDQEFSSMEKDRLLKDRNIKWMDKIPSIINDQPTFIAIGAGHLAGNSGLINLLRSKGYTVTPVKI